LVLTEGAILGGGAFSRVSEVKEETTGNTYAMKRMKKQAVVQCPEHVYFEQVRHALALPSTVMSRITSSLKHSDNTAPGTTTSVNICLPCPVVNC
jgi:hypothetical protein